PFMLHTVLSHLINSRAPDLKTAIHDLLMGDTLLAGEEVNELRALIDRHAQVLDIASFPLHDQTRFKLFPRDVVIRNKAQALIDVKHLAKIRIHRVAMSSSDWEPWLFGDASKFAYGACAYIFDRKTSTARLLISRGRLASVNTKSTTPQLELAAAVLLAETYSVLRASFGGAIQKVPLFIDSQVTWHRLRTNQNRLDQYVTSRVNHVNQLTNLNDWYHI